MARASLPGSLHRRGPYPPTVSAADLHPLAEARLKRGQTQEEAAKEIGTSRTFIAAIETGRKKVPTTRSKAADAFRRYMNGVRTTRSSTELRSGSRSLAPRSRRR